MSSLVLWNLISGARQVSLVVPLQLQVGLVVSAAVGGFLDGFGGCLVKFCWTSSGRQLET